MIPFKTLLSSRINMNQVRQIIDLAEGDKNKKEELFSLIFDENDQIAYQAAWAFTHFSANENKWLHNRLDILIDEALTCMHPSKRRTLLQIIYMQPLPQTPRVDFTIFVCKECAPKKSRSAYSRSA